MSFCVTQGFEVSGSDISWNVRMDSLHEAGVKVHLGHSITCLENKTTGKRPDAIIISSSIPKDNEEVVHAESVGIPMLVLLSISPVIFELVSFFQTNLMCF